MDSFLEHSKLKFKGPSVQSPEKKDKSVDHTAVQINQTLIQYNRNSLRREGEAASTVQAQNLVNPVLSLISSSSQLSQRPGVTWGDAMNGVL